MKTVRFISALIAVPSEVSIAEAKKYIRSELAAAGGCRHPDDSLFEGLVVIAMKRVQTS